MIGSGGDVATEGKVMRVLWLLLQGYEGWIRGGRKKRVRL